MELEPLLPQVLDATQMSCFRSCPEKFNLEFVYGVRPSGLSIDLHAGGCLATALEETYREIYLHKQPLEHALLIAHGEFVRKWGNFQIPTWKRTAKTMERTWEAVVGDGTAEGQGYFQAYPPLSDWVKPYIAADGKPTFEYTFAIPLEPIGKLDDGLCFPEHPNGGPFLYAGRFDMLGQKQDGTPIPRDEKTAGASAGQDWSEKWKLRGQFIGYVWALRQCGIMAESVLVRGIHILKESIRHSEHEQPYSQMLLDRWHNQLRRDVWRMRKMWDESYFDFNLGEACTTYGSCIFLQCCETRNPIQWLSDMEVRRWNPLEKNPVDHPQKELANAV